VPPESFVRVVANITVRALEHLKGDIRSALKPGGFTVLSGVLADAVPKFRKLLTGCGWRHERAEQEGDWVAIVLRRPVGMPTTTTLSETSTGR
jgi:ribosomal protein L11 methyltransferase